MSGIIYFFGHNQLLIILISVGIVLMAQGAVKSKYKKWSKVPNSRGLTGAQVASMIMTNNGISDVNIEMIGGNLTDHYDPTKSTVRLSQGVYQGNSIASIAIAAHEVGHVIQHKKGSLSLSLRTKVFPAANISSNMSGFVIITGLILGALNLIYLGIILLAVGFLFQVITLPVEFGASNNAIKQMKAFNIISDNEVAGTKEVLGAAAMTYVVAALVSLLNILRLIGLARR